MANSKRKYEAPFISAASPTAPVVFPLSPCCQDLATASQVTVGCLVSGYFPEPVKVQWNSGSASDIRTFPALLDSSSGHYTLSSQLTIPTSTWESEKLQCHIVHTATSSTINKELGPCEKKDPVAPKVRLLHSSCKASSRDATIELMCVISNFYPNNVTVNWLVSEKPMSQPSFTEQPWKDTHGYTFSTISTVNISQADWEDGNVYVCQVSHTATQTSVRSKAKICEDSSGTPLKVFILPPSPNDLYMDKQPKLSCVVVNLESEEEELEVTWSRQTAGSLSPEPLAWREEVNNTFTASSSVIISASAWLSGEPFICTVQHPSLPQPKTREISKKKETKEAPGVYLFRPHDDELRSNGRYVSITALVRGFKPSDISLKWLKNGNPLPEADYLSTPVYSDGDGLYFLFSKLKVPKADWNRGDAYTCMVVHEGLTLKFIQKTIEKSRVIIISTEVDLSDEVEEELEKLWTTILVFFILFLISVCYSTTMTLFKVKWIFSTVADLKKQPVGPEYKNVIPQTF
ncbi:Y heavy chain constant region [Podarcis lilfordi]|uniref:Y heavy chain constant region n=1 Tax=Podarcis lilfordi TaxID=74358 RepID=A0AA35L7N6_9SAUR|nr:Y heavy chain constant region [Podarcis lilfordi]